MNKPRKTQRKNPEQRTRRPHSEPQIRHYEAEAAEGLEDISRKEFIFHLGNRIELHHSAKTRREPGVIRFDYAGGLRALLRMNTVQAIYLTRRFEAARPSALLGDQNLRLLLADIASIREVHPPAAFKTFYISAAGGDSSILKRLKAEVTRHTNLQEGSEEGDLLIRLRRPPSGSAGWEILMRISPRPLTTRPWRVCNMEGALNATIAHAMALMTDPRPYDTFLNVACGSGTLLVERLNCGPAKQVIGCDINPEVLACAAENIEAAGLTQSIELHQWDARSLPLPDASIDALCADLPFGHLVGSHDENVALYPALLAEAARVAKPGALFALITHEINLMQMLLKETTGWRGVGEQRVALGGLYPRIFVLQRV